MKKPAGKEIQRLSFSLILTIKPHSISKPSPNDEIARSGLNSSPINRPVAPKNSKIMVNRPSFSKSNRLNSFFICGDVK